MMIGISSQKYILSRLLVSSLPFPHIVYYHRPGWGAGANKWMLYYEGPSVRALPFILSLPSGFLLPHPFSLPPSPLL